MKRKKSMIFGWQNRICSIEFRRFVEFFLSKIFDENGEDVTPRPIDDSVRLNLFFPQHDDEILNSRRASKFTLDNLDVSFSDKSTSATTNLTSSISRMGKTGTKFSLGYRFIFDFELINTDRLSFLWFIMTVQRWILERDWSQMLNICSFKCNLIKHSIRQVMIR